ncbi:hypothetical protein [Pseudomonas tohonis]|uniref:hypothetical protein n=1 Tax=Pseudomonas tohonis TaxID=2725477 RepID=UPI0022F07B6E|nr:hypothetical protein [Pseudomonas tohonis]
MFVLYVLFMLYFALPFASGYAVHRIIKAGMVPHFYSKALTRIKKASFLAWLAFIITTTLSLSIVLGIGAVLAPWETPLWALNSTVLLVFICTGAMSYLRFRDLIVRTAAHRLVKLFYGLLILAVVWVSNIYADATILDYTKINPSDIYSAKAGVLAVTTLMMWVMVISAASLIPYIVHLFYIASAASKYNKFNIAILEPGLRSKPNPALHNNFINFSFAAGLALCSTGPISSLAATSKDPSFEPFLRKLIVFASFHMGQSPCAGTQPDGTRLAQLGYDRIAIATPDKDKGYVFEVRKCTKTEAAKEEAKPKVGVSLPSGQYAL